MNAPSPPSSPSSPSAAGPGHPFQRLLLATERTEHDGPAEITALAMAARCGLPLRAVVPVRSNPEFEVAAPELALRAERALASQLAGLEDQARRDGVRLETVLRRGEEPWREIVDEAQASATDLLITRHRGRQGILARLLVGEMVSKVAGHVHCSMLMVPPPGGLWSRHVLAAVDASAHGPVVARQAAAVAATCGLPLTVVSVAPDESPAARAAAEAVAQRCAAAAQQAAALGSAVQARVATGRPYEAIVQVADQVGADLIVLGRRGETELSELLLGSTAQRVVGLARRAVMLVQAGSMP